MYIYIEIFYSTINWQNFICSEEISERSVQWEHCLFSVFDRYSFFPRGKLAHCGKIAFGSRSVLLLLRVRFTIRQLRQHCVGGIQYFINKMVSLFVLSSQRKAQGYCIRQWDWLILPVLPNSYAPCTGIHSYNTPFNY